MTKIYKHVGFVLNGQEESIAILVGTTPTDVVKTFSRLTFGGEDITIEIFKLNTPVLSAKEFMDSIPNTHNSNYTMMYQHTTKNLHQVSI